MTLTVTVVEKTIALEFPTNAADLKPQQLNAAKKFSRIIAEEHGGYVPPQPWKGALKPHLAICASQHECYPYPANIQQRWCGPCRTCAGLDPATAEAAFRESLAIKGHQPAYDKWEGVHKPHRAICVNQHECYPYPASIQRGQGVCRRCWVEHDVFYIVENSSGDIKFGVSSGNPNGRLTDHKSDGYRTLLFLKTALPTGLADTAENAILYDLTAVHGLYPIRGREYFGPESKDLVLSLANKYLSEDERVN